jgi:hypothetical protein
MSLDEQAIERWARQIVLPEVGGRGQLRLLGARAAVAGSGEAARFARLLLERAGVGLAPDPDPAAADVALDLSGDAAIVVRRGRAARAAARPFVAAVAGDATAVVATFVGRGCIDCTPLGVAPSGGEAGAPFALALGALAAGEALRVLLAPAAGGRLQTLDLRTGAVAGRGVDAVACAACGTGVS